MVARAAGQQRPNIVFILTDHFRRDAVGPRTPHLCRLADEGTQFSNAYCAAPLCQPSRAALITGLLPSQNGICGNMAPPLPPHLRAETFMRQLQSAGYATALIGKHHYIDAYGLGYDVTTDDERVQAYGFDTVCQVLDAGENLHNDDRYTHYLRERGLLEEYRRVQREQAATCGPYPLPAAECEDGFIAGQTCAFIRAYDDTRPFYLNVGFIGPHPPYWHPGEIALDAPQLPPALGTDPDPRTGERRAHYLEKCALLDHFVGQIVAALADRGLLDNTVVIFTSDHGDMLGDFGLWDKRFFYEQSVGVPLILRGPGAPRGARGLTGKLSRALVSLLDLYPTILRLAGVTSAASRYQRAGQDLLARADAASSREAIVAELGTATMIRTANWKLTFDAEQGGIQRALQSCR